jgi:uncharacterized protein (TIGR01244 family)
MNHFRLFGALILSLGIGGCVHSGSYESRESDGLGYKSYHEKVFLAGQPTNEQLASLKSKEKIEVVINLRSAEEIKGLNFDPKDGAESLKLTYYNLPFFKDGELDKDTIAKIESTFMTHHKAGQKVLVNCSSGNRAAAWFATHFANHHGDPIDKAISEGQAAGMHGELVAKVREHLKATKGGQY